MLSVVGALTRRLLQVLFVHARASEAGRVPLPCAITGEVTDCPLAVRCEEKTCLLLKLQFLSRLP